MDAHLLRSLGKHFFVMERYGTDEVYLAVFVILLHDIPFEESLEAVQHKRVHAGFVQVLCKER